MVAKSELQFAGEYLLDECSIITTSGKTFNIKDIIEEINIFENIYTSSVTGNILVKDTTNIINNFPIVGEERLVLKILTPQSKPQPETTIDYTLSPLMIYKVNLQEGDGENAQIISLQFGSIEGFRNNTAKVSQSFGGQPSQIVEKILRDTTYLNSKKTFYYEPTANNVKVVFPNIRPFDSICREEPKFSFKETVGAQLNEQGIVDVQSNMDNIVNYQIVSSRDTNKNISSGMLSSKLITHDVYHKRLDLYKYDYLSNFDRDIHPDNGESTPIISTAKDPDTNKSLTDHEDTKLYVVSTASGYSFSENGNYPYQSDNKNQTLQRKHSRKEQFDKGLTLNVEINGQTFIQAGDKIDLSIGATSAFTDDALDKNLSGGYVVTHLRHTFTQSGQLKHKIIMRVAKDSKKGEPLPSVGIQPNDDFATDTNKSRSVNVAQGYMAGSDYTVA